MTREEKFKKEIERTNILYSYYNEYKDYKLICGIDEVGRGPYAGDVVASAVILDTSDKILYLNDSKKLTEKKREELFDIIKERAISIGIGIVGAKEIDKINILNATYKAMQKAICDLKIKPDILINDAVLIPDISYKQVPLIKGDTLCPAISAASIIAKVTRDRMMKEYDLLYPEYKFAKNKGYGTKEHEEAIRKYGLCEIHRRTFCKKFLN